ncbi:MAG: FkbM family methyltransferase [Phycisphaerales bacterium]|nr:FkbM family methyltransferase [Phycisphaerales bacterium]
MGLHMSGAADQLVSRLDETQHKCLEMLGTIRNETIDQLIDRFGPRECARVPKGILKHARALVQQTYAGSGVDGAHAYVDLPNGRRFYSWPSKRNHAREFAYLADLLPALSAETYLTAKDITARYLTDWAWYPSEVLPGAGGVVVEVGAYLGHKSMRFVDECIGETGKVLAIEILPENVEILERNIAYNGLKSVIDTRQCGVWNGPGSLTVQGKGRQRNSLVGLDKIDPTVSIEVRTDSLDNILDGWRAEGGPSHVDFMILTVNGAEREVLDGLDRWWDRVHHLYVAACYTVDGESTYDACMARLKDRGADILPSTTPYEIYARNPRFGV